MDNAADQHRQEAADQHLDGEDDAAENDGEGAELGLDQSDSEAEPDHRLVDDQRHEDLEEERETTIGE